MYGRDDIDRVFEIAHKFTAEAEGGITDDKTDRGGLTYYGVSLKYLKDLAKDNEGLKLMTVNGLKLPVCKDTVRQVTPEIAKVLFKYSFYHDTRIFIFPPALAIACYDMAVNSGSGNAIKTLQRMFNQTYKAGLKIDGIAGCSTGDAAEKIYFKHGIEVIENYMNRRREFYKAICKKDESQNKFIKGWLARADKLEKYIKDLSGKGEI